MRLPAVTGTIARRVLVNFRVRADVLQRHVPAPFRVQTVDGFGVAGICLIRLAHSRPRWLPAWCGLGSENAAHRIAVTRDTADGLQTGVYVLRRDTSSRLYALLGGRVFPGHHHRAAFTVHETANDYSIALRSRDGATHIEVRGHVAEALPRDSVFADLPAASRFFERGALGWSPGRDPACHDCLELCSFGWRVTPLAIDHVRSSWFDDRTRFPEGSIALDSALLMRDVAHEWRAHPSLTASAQPTLVS